MMDFEYDIKQCIDTLSKGGTILYPTDTVWGIGCDALNENAIKKVYDVKHRPANKSFIILLADSRDILQYVAAPPPDIIAMLDDFDRPTTVIYDGALGFPEILTGEHGSVAIRVTSDPFCKALIKRFRKPIVSTSANISGDPTPAIYNQVSEEIRSGVDYIVQYRRDDEAISPPSRLIKITDDGEITILRP
ncbi:MAG: L-threonylcarbamoyladenylate synthase [Flavipsychrobacter sp.]